MLLEIKKNKDEGTLNLCFSFYWVIQLSMRKVISLMMIIINHTCINYYFIISCSYTGTKCFFVRLFFVSNNNIIFVTYHFFPILWIQVPSWLWHLSGGTSAVLMWFSSFYGRIFPHLNVSLSSIANQKGPNFLVKVSFTYFCFSRLTSSNVKFC